MRSHMIIIAIAVAFLGLTAHRVWRYATVAAETNVHPAGLHAGHLVSLGEDRYHVEIIFTRDGTLKLYTLDRDGSRPIEVDSRPLTAHVTADGEAFSQLVELRPDPQPGDAPGKTSCFSGQTTAPAGGGAVRVSVPNLVIGGERFHLAYVAVTAEHPAMPSPAAADEERALHLTPAGKYTEADIEANGRTFPSQKYRGFQARHDLSPKSGDFLCPITRTKAAPTCTWMVEGQTYRFCCPPCIDEFVRLAKTAPDKVRPADEYVAP